MAKVSVIVSFIMNIIIIMATFRTGYRAPFFYLNRPKYIQKISYSSNIPSSLQKHLSTTYFINPSVKDYLELADNIFTITNYKRDTSSQREFLNTYLVNESKFIEKKDSNIQNTHEPLNKNYFTKLNNTPYIMDEHLSKVELIVKKNNPTVSELKQRSNLKLESAMQELSLRLERSSSTEGLSISTKTTVPITLNAEVKESINELFYKALDQLERKFYSVTFTKLSLISPADRKENGISFVQSSLFLQLMLIALSTEVDEDVSKEINECLGLQVSYKDKISMINKIVSTFPKPHTDLRFYWSSRLAIWPGHEVSEQFKNYIAPSLRVIINSFNGTETPEQVAQALNHMVEIDSGGAIHATFDEDEISEGIQAIMLTTLYLRARWRSAPTLLNGTRLFRDTEDAPRRFVRCIRINDIMRYADLTEWDAEAVEISYATPGLSLLLLIPRGRSLRRLAEMVTKTSINEITRRTHTVRIGTTLPLYTLRMTLLLPNKLELMGISKLMGVNPRNGSFTLSHAVQRIMFWAEAGRNAFKDDGIEWDEAPLFELVVDRPYIFFVRWNNLTIMNGNFVL